MWYYGKGKQMKKYNIIYADPPWMETGGGKIKRGADRHYPLMKTKDICALPINQIADNNCHLYLWTTNAFLPDALKVMEAWGFTYKTMITWVKDKIGLGQYFRGMSEHCLFGVKGNLPYKTDVEGKRMQGRTAFYAPKSVHSKKPDEMREMIHLVSDRENIKKIELFAREKNNGWDVLGYDVNEGDIKLALQKMIYEMEN